MVAPGFQKNARWMQVKKRRIRLGGKGGSAFHINSWQCRRGRKGENKDREGRGKDLS